MKVPALIVAGLCSLASLASAQEAALTADTDRLAGQGGVLTFTASARYEGTPGAVGWSITLPPSWALVAVVGANVPEIAPQPEAGGTLEFAYTTPPAGGASFMVSVRYPAGAAATTVESTAIVRAEGRLRTVATAPLSLRTTQERPVPNGKER